MKSLLYCCILDQHCCNMQGLTKSLFGCWIWHNIVATCKATWSHCWTAASGTTLFLGHMKSLLYSCIWYNFISKQNKLSHYYIAAPGIILFLGNMKSLLYFKAVSSTTLYQHARQHEVTVILLHLIQHFFKATGSHWYTAVLIQHYFKAKWSQCYTAAPDTTLIQGHMKSLLYCCIWYKFIPRPHEVTVILLHLV